MNSCFYFSQLQQFFELLVEPLKSAAIVTTQGETLFVKHENLADLGTLSHAAQISHQYVKLNDGDIVITNDPYSGGSILSSFTLTMGLSSQSTRKTQKQSQADLLISYRVHLKPKIEITQKVDDEGIRLPPTPLYTALADKPSQRKNKELIAAIKQHPHCPKDFDLFIEDAVETLLDLREKFKAHTNQLGLDWSRTLVRKYLKLSQKMTQQFISQLCLGESHVEYSLEDGSKIKLRIEVIEKSILFDFTGTNSSSELHLTDSATYGACLGAVLAVLNEKIPLNLGFFNCFEIIAPAGTIVNAVYPQPVFQGMVDGTQFIAELALKAFGKIDKQKQMASASPTLCAFELEFADNKRLFETLSSGAPATSTQKGYDGVSLWTRSQLNPRLELIEKLYPVQLKTYAFRANSGGSGNRPGGDGTTKAITINEPAKLRWIMTSSKQNPLGISGGKAATGAEIYIKKKESESKKLPSRGLEELSAGDTIIVHSAGGGGFGES